MMTTRQPLDKALRRTLEATVIKARDIAELAAIQALNRLGVGDAKPADYLNDEQRKLRTRLRARGRQLGDIKKDNGQQGTHKLVAEVAYEHWHRMLFARFLEQNNLLMYDEHTPLSLDECNELAQDADSARDDLERQCESGWELAGVLASKMLPQIFRIDSPVFELEFAPEHQRSLEQLVTGLSLETFQAQDSLGWVYQFWQSKRKDEVNKSEVKIGADELSPVTQLFTEPYMVSFLLDNALGAWWAGKRLTESDWQNAQSEKELRDKAAIEGVSLEYLRFVQDEQTKQWQPASGTFDAWPDDLSEFKAIDPCCGSGHFLVAIFLMLVPMRMQLGNLSEQQAIDKVLSENLYGLELDQRCVELAVFALALEAWRYKNGGGYRRLPELHLACSGLSIAAARDEWKELSRKAGKQNLSIALDWMYQTFQDAPVLGSLINPRRSDAAKIAKWDDLQQLLGDALAKDQSNTYDSDSSEQTNQLEAGIVAQGLAKAAELLGSQYTWVVTNVPYLGRGNQDDLLKDYSESYYPEGKNDLATVFLERCLEFCNEGGTSSVVLPQNWLFLTTYRKFREKLLKQNDWLFVVKLGGGAEAFEVGPGNITNIAMVAITRGNAPYAKDLLNTNYQTSDTIGGLDVTKQRTTLDKARSLIVDEVITIKQTNQLENPDARVAFNLSEGQLLSKIGLAPNGLHGADSLRFRLTYWEVSDYSIWEFLQGTVDKIVHYGGRSEVFFWKDSGRFHETNHKARIQGHAGWDKKGVAISMMASLPSTIHTGHLFDISCSPIVPKEGKYLAALWCYCVSDNYNKAVRQIDQKLNVTNATLVKVPFDLERWTNVAEEQYPNGLPEPYTNDPTQWIFHGHPCASVIWDEETKWTVNGELRVDDSVLQVAVARLLGYQWPAELDQDMELAVEQREWVARSQEFNQFVDDDGIVCLPAVRGEKAADQRLELLLQAAYGEAWTTPLKNRLLETVGGKSLNQWLRDKFFEQHCKMFQHRPFIWHIWDGLNDGFSALVNYHILNKAGLERLIYTYLGDWIRTQQSGMASGEDGAQERLAAAEALKHELEAILEGEAPYDIFVRWKSLEEQPIGWNPDINDGVRLNIRPFLKARDVGKKDAGVLRWKPNVKWTKDRGKDVESAPWYTLGLEYEGKEGDRINDHHLMLADKQKAKGG